MNDIVPGAAIINRTEFVLWADVDPTTGCIIEPGNECFIVSVRHGSGGSSVNAMIIVSCGNSAKIGWVHMTPSCIEARVSSPSTPRRSNDGS